MAESATQEFARLLGDPMPAHVERLENGLRGLWEDEDQLSRVDRDRILAYLRNKKLTTPAEALMLISVIDAQRALIGQATRSGQVFEAAVQHIVAE